MAERKTFLIHANQDGVFNRLTFREFNDYARRLAAKLMQMGCVDGDKVLFCRSHSPALMAGIAGCLLAGIVPVVFAHPSDKFSVRDYLSMVRLLGDQLRPDLAIFDETIMNDVDVNFSFNVVGSAVFEPKNLTSALLLPPGGTDQRTERVSLIQYSSGTTGLKKGVVITEEALLRQIDDYAKALNLSPQDKVASWLPLYHDMGLITGFLLPWLTGITLATMSPFDWVTRPEKFWELIRKTKSTLMWQPNFAFAYLARTFALRDNVQIDLSSLRMITNCSEPITSTAQQDFLEVFEGNNFSKRNLATCYALAETTFAVTNSCPGVPPVELNVDPRKLGAGDQIVAGAMVLVSSGRSIEGTKIEIVDCKGHLVSDRVVGEIKVHSESMMSGYLDVQDNLGLLADGTFLTGDIGFLDAGELYVLGRKDDVLIVRGQNIHPHTVEDRVSIIHGVVPGRCVAFGTRMISHDSEDLVIVAESRECDDGLKETIATEIRRCVRQAFDISPHTVRIVAHMSLVKSTSGKIARRANKESFERSMIVQRQGRLGHQTIDFTGDLREFIKSELEIEVNLEDHTPLFSGGLVDSLGLVNILIFIEQRLGRKIGSPMEIGLERFDSIGQIVSLLSDPPEPMDTTRFAFERPIWVDKVHRFQVAQKSFDCIWLASSTLMATPTRSLNSIGFDAFNFAASSATTVDYYAFMRLVEQEQIEPVRRIVIGLDPIHVVQDYLSPTFSRPNRILDHFLPEIDVIPLVEADIAQTKNGRRNTEIIDKLNEIQNVEWKPLRNRWRVLANGDIEPIGQNLGDQTGLMTTVIDAHIESNKVRLANRSRFVPGVQGKAIRGLAKIARRNNATVDIIIPPVHPRFLTTMLEDSHYRRCIDLTCGLIRHAHFDQLVVHDFRDIGNFGGTDTDFEDPTHPGPENCLRLLNQVFENLEI